MSQLENPYMAPLERVFRYGRQYLDQLDALPVGSMASYEQLKSIWSWNLPKEGTSPEVVVDELIQSSEPGLHTSQSGRFFAWVIGGSHPASMAADWLTSVWDQNSGMFAVAPSAAVVEEIAGKWLKELLGLPGHSSFALVTGCQMAHFTCLAAARHELFRRVGWDVENAGFYGAPRIRVLCSDQKHVTIDRAMRMLGFGTSCLIQIPTDDSGRIEVNALAHAFEAEPDTPTLLFLQAGDLNTGGFDDFTSIIPIARKYNCWVHVDGAFGLWAAASDTLKHLVKGVELADSWATDGHKWLNVPYDCGYAFVAHPEAHAAAFGQKASYLVHVDKARDQVTYNPEFSRRGRGFATWAVIRELGSSGIEQLIDRTCRHARNIVESAGRFPGVEIVAMPVINQGLLRFHAPGNAGDQEADDRFTENVMQNINASGEAFFQATTYKSKRCMRVSVSGWRTSDEDVRRTVKAIGGAIQIEGAKA